MKTIGTLRAIFASAILICTPLLVSAKQDKLQVLLQGTSAPDLATLVENVGGEVTHDLHIIDSVMAMLTQKQLAIVLKSPAVYRHIDDLLAMDPPEVDTETCRVRGHVELDFIPGGIRWPLYNKLPNTESMERIELSWPPALGEITKLTIGKAAVDPALFRGAPIGTLEIKFPRKSMPEIRGRADLIIKFSNPLPTGPDGGLRQRDFKFNASFSGGCSTDLVPGYENNHEDYYYNSVAGIDALHQQGITGRGITIAVIDSGMWEHENLRNDTAGRSRIVARYDARTGLEGEIAEDESGHGTHMASIIAHSGPTLKNGLPTDSFKGVAPDANLVVVKVLDKEGFAHLLELVKAIQWVVDHRDIFRIRVLNLSFAQPPRWPYWEDPVNQAVMRAWASGIAVVAAAGNEGPEPMTIGSPGNLPYIITVGAVTDSWTPNTRDDDYIPEFSSRGPTPSGHVKPDVVALGGHMTGIMPPQSSIMMEQPEDILRTGEIPLTGSSQASALVSGILALLLQIEPDLSPDDLKCKLISSAEPAINNDGLLAYSPFEQGYGYVNATRAVTLGVTGCGNAEWDLAADIAGEQHFYGPAIIDENGAPSLEGLEDMLSPQPSEKGFSETRKWGVKDHMESTRIYEESNSRPTPFNWQEIYTKEKSTIENLVQPSPTHQTPP